MHNTFLNKKLLFIFSFAFLFCSNMAFASVTSLVDFNDTGDLTDKFNPSTSTQFTNTADGGIGNTGAINVPLGSNEVWTTKQAYTVAGEGDIYTFSAYFKIQANSGYGGLGFTTANTGNTTDSYGSPATGIGMGFHGGGGFFVNNRVNEDVSWPPDLVLGNWYKMILRVEAIGSNQYDLNFKIYNSDADGVLGSLKTEQTTTVTNATVAGSNIIYGYFSAAGSRMAKIDDFEMTLEGGATFIEAGAPIVTTASVTDVTSSTASSGGEVTDDQGGAVTVRGVCWSETTAPTTADDCTEDGTGEGVFTSELTGLTQGTTYYLRAYATNASGTTYGLEQTFTTDADSTAPVLTEVTPLTGTIDLEDGTYYFTSSEVCELLVSQPTSTKGEVTVLAESVTVGQNIGITLTGMQAGGRYSFTFSCMDAADNESNTLSVGPFTIRENSSGSSGSFSMAALLKFRNQVNENTDNKNEDNMCPSDLILTQNLNKGARNGVFNRFTGGIVKEAHILQKHLNRLGFDSGPEDGIIGPLTEGAIKRMQSFLKTKPDGDVGPMTRELINKSC
ncbi:MAG: hypothetical protein QG580_311 [Patescibacteria group bacterium]|jgi:hypothetical protein|nr:hypothetical protein [Patescibacteria group bacterium]